MFWWFPGNKDARKEWAGLSHTKPPGFLHTFANSICPSAPLSRSSTPPHQHPEAEAMQHDLPELGSFQGPQHPLGMCQNRASDRKMCCLPFGSPLIPNLQKVGSTLKNKEQEPPTPARNPNPSICTLRPLDPQAFLELLEVLDVTLLRVPSRPASLAAGVVMISSCQKKPTRPRRERTRAPRRRPGLEWKTVGHM